MTKETLITLPMGKADIQDAALAVIEYLATTPPDFSTMSEECVISYGMGVNLLITCLRSTLAVQPVPLASASKG